MGRLIMKPFNLEEYLANPSRKVVTLDGRKVRRILCTDARGNYPIIALVERHDGTVDDAVAYTKDGKYLDGVELSIRDLFFAPEKHERWINLYKDDGIVYASMDTFDTKKEADFQGNAVIVAAQEAVFQEHVPGADHIDPVSVQNPVDKVDILYSDIGLG